MKLSQYAKKMGVTYQTAHKWFKESRIDDAYQLSTGTIVIPERMKNQNAQKQLFTLAFCRTNSVKQT